MKESVIVVNVALALMLILGAPVFMSPAAAPAIAQDATDSGGGEREEEIISNQRPTEPANVTGAYYFKAPKKLSLMGVGKTGPEKLKQLTEQVAALNTQMEKVCKQLKILVDHSKNMTKHVNGLKKRGSRMQKK